MAGVSSVFFLATKDSVKVFSTSLDKTKNLEREYHEGTNFANFQAFFALFAYLRHSR